MSNRRVIHIKAGERKFIPVKTGTKEIECLAGVSKISNRDRTVSRLLQPGSQLKLKSPSIYFIDAKTDMLLSVCG